VSGSRELVLYIRDGGDSAPENLGPVETFSQCLIGRGGDADLFLSHESVSRQHCLIYREDDVIYVKDLESSRGTKLDGEPLTEPRQLAFHHELTVGDMRIKVRQRLRQNPVATVLKEAGPSEATFIHTGGRAPVSSADMHILLYGDTISIGRDAQSDHVLADDVLVSRQHALFRRTAGGWCVQDLGSSNGTFVNGQRIRRIHPLEPGDMVTIGSYQLRFDGKELRSKPPGQGVSIRVQSVAVPGRNDELVLQDVNFDLQPRELVALIGISGSGKTRLMHAMCGRAPLAAGRVLYDEEDFYARFDALKKTIGYVPSWLTLHTSLTVMDALRYTSRLRLAADTTQSEVDANIERVLATVKVSHRKASVISTLSDGEKRRVGLAVELLSRPPVMLLDEVTTALDLPTHCALMKLFRNLADEGQTLLLISHHLEDLDSCDRWLYLIDGRVAFFGTPQNFKWHFNVQSLREQLERQDELRGKKTGAQWAREFAEGASGPPGGDEEEAVRVRGAAGAGSGDTPWDKRWAIIRHQSRILTSRYRMLLQSDRRGLLLMLGVAAIIALIIGGLNTALDAQVSDAQTAFDNGPSPASGMALVIEKLGQQRVLSFMLVISTVMIGSFIAIREVVKENEISRHERFCGLELLPYLASKLLLLGALSIMSTLLMLVIVKGLVGSGFNGNLVTVVPILSVLAFSSVTMALLISAAVDNSEKAFQVLLPVLVVQFALCGGLVPLKDSPVEPISQIAVLDYWALKGVTGAIPLIETGDDGFDGNAASIIETANDEALGSTGAGASMLVLLLHALVYVSATFVLLVRRDGPPVVARVRSEVLGLLPRNDEGNVALDVAVSRLKSSAARWLPASSSDS